MIVLVGDHYAAIKGGAVIGVIVRGGGSWCWRPNEGSAMDYINLPHAIIIALRACA